MNIFIKGLFIASIFSVLLNQNVWATRDHKLKNSNECQIHFDEYEQKYQIPNDLLRAVSISESGLWHDKIKAMIPWPWAINVTGKGYYFNSKKEAIEAVLKYQKQGYKSIDIGCMQINLFYHPKAFSSLEEAFEPEANISYAASFLKDNYKRHLNWYQAVASYHSENQKNGWPYAKKVIENWRKLKIDEFLVDKKRVVNENKNFVNSSVSKNKSLYWQKRRRSNIFIKVHDNRGNQYKMIESIANNAIQQFGKK